jgi:periplasmic protein TonB
MNGHPDILDQPEPFGKWVLWSVVFHLSIAGGLLAFNWIGPRSAVKFGELNGGGIGSVSVNVVPRVPLPSRSGPVNPVANDTESKVPEPLPKVKQKPQLKAPPPDAIPLKSRNAEKRPSVAESAPNKFRAQQKDLPNQLYSNSGQAVVSPMYGLTGGGGVGIGNNSPFGEQFGYYANLLRDKVARNWRTNELDPRLHNPPPVVVTFTILRDGSVPSGSVRVEQRSGNPALDYSAQRAIMDAAPFPSLPAGFSRSSADIEFVFQLRH